MKKFALPEQLTMRSLLIGTIGSIIISAASVYAALKTGALPWPIMFVSLLSLLALKMFRKKHATLNEINITQTGMSAGAMIAGALAFTIPGMWILNPNATVELWQVVITALCGTILGLFYTSLLRKRLINQKHSTYPIGLSACTALKATKDGSINGKMVFGSMGITALYVAARDYLKLLPASFVSGNSISGIALGILNMPMLWGIGFLLGTSGVIAWLTGGIIGDYGIVCAGSSLGLWDIETGYGIKTSLGMGAMIGCGIAVIIKITQRLLARKQQGQEQQDIVQQQGTEKLSISGNQQAVAQQQGQGQQAITLQQESKILRVSLQQQNPSQTTYAGKQKHRLTICIAFSVWIVVIPLVHFCLGVSLLAALLLGALSFLAVLMSAQSVGESGINPMEVFGVMTLLAITAVCDIPVMQMFFIAAVVTVACGLTGDLMNDFKMGSMLGTNPQAQCVAQAAGGLVGALIASIVLCVLFNIYGPDAFGANKMFVSAQAEIVANLINGVPNLTAFFIGLFIAGILYLLGAPIITFGIGIYLPSIYSLTILFGFLIKCAVKRLSNSQKVPECIAAGMLGGESIMGVLSAFMSFM